MEAVEVLWAAHQGFSDDWRVNRHCHEYAQVFYAVGGSFSASVDGRNLRLGSRDCLLVNSWVTHQFAAMEPRSECLEVKFQLNNHRLSSALGRTILLSPASESVKRMIEQIIAEGEGRRAHFREVAASILEVLLWTIARESRCGEAQPWAPDAPREATDLWERRDGTGFVLEVIDYLTKHLHEEITLEKLGQRFGYHPSYLCDKFSSIVGTPPMRFLANLRLERAKRLLLETDCPVKEVASAVGYTSHHTFTRAFTQKTGLSPTELREGRRAKRQSKVYFVQEPLSRSFAPPPETAMIV